MGDLNGDGRPDLAVAADFDNRVSILLGKPDGTFEARVGYATGSGPSSVTVGDFNRDGKMDLAVANFDDHTVSILLGRGDGTFGTHLDYGTGPNPASVVTGDFNGDGKLDLAIANQNCPSIACGSGSVSILLGKGDGTFQAHLDYATGHQPSSVAVGDFNGDRKLDLVVVNQNCATFPCGLGSVSILLGKGDGTFGSRLDYGIGPYACCHTPSLLATGDFNGDGNLDLAVAEGLSSTVSILLGRGNGTFKSRVDYATGSEPASVTVGDFNRDGKLDLAVANENCLTRSCGAGSVSILLGKGDGTFQAHVDYATGSFLPSSVATGDFNGDGKLDLALGNFGYPATVSILLGNGDGTFQAPVVYSTGSKTSSVTTGDFNGDGKLDLAVANFDFGTVSILLGRGDGTFQSHVDYATGFYPQSVATGDFNGDGKLDLATGNDANMVSILLGNGDGTFQGHIKYFINHSARSVTTGDFNGDGKLDLAVASSTLSVLLGNGDGTFQTYVDYATGFSPQSVAVGDFNGDGRLDVATANDNSTISIVLNVPVIALFPTQLSFGNQPVGATSGPKTVLASNPSPARLRISSITISGADPGDFAETETRIVAVVARPSWPWPDTGGIPRPRGDGAPVLRRGIPRAEPLDS